MATQNTFKKPVHCPTVSNHIGLTIIQSIIIIAIGIEVRTLETTIEFPPTALT